MSVIKWGKKQVKEKSNLTLQTYNTTDDKKHDCVCRDQYHSQRPGSREFSSESVKSDWSKDSPPYFNNEPGPSDTK